METKPVTIKDLKHLYVPPVDSHKGQNGRLLIIGGSHLFHAASLWALEVASRIVDLVHYSSVPENNEIVQNLKEQFRSGIIVPRPDVEEYIKEDDCILIGPGMMRMDTSELRIKNEEFRIKNLSELENIKDEGTQTAALTNYLLEKYPEKQWVIDAGALQMCDVKLIPKNAILTPHHREFEDLIKRAEVAGLNLADFSIPARNKINPLINTFSLGSEKPQNLTVSPRELEEVIYKLSKKMQCIILLKGQTDIVCSPTESRTIVGGNAGMTKGGTGDVLAGLIAALACKNPPFLATITGSYINKKAGEALAKTVGPFFNASDLAYEIPRTMKELILTKLSKR